MTEPELGVILEFLTGGLLVGIIGHWLDVVVAYVRKR